MAGVEFLIFEGVSSDLRPWISALEDQFALEDYSDLNKLALAVYLIGGKAEWFVQNRHEFKYFETWDDLKSSLILKFGEPDDPERIKLEAERGKLVLNGQDNETIKNTDAMEHIVNLEPNEMHQEESEINTTKVDQEMEVVCSIQDKLSLEEINSLLETDGFHPREAKTKSQVLVSSTESDHGEILLKNCSMDRITVNQIDLVKNVECFDVAWLFSSKNLMDSVMVGDEFSKNLLDMEMISNAHQMYDRTSLRAKSRKQLKCWKFKYKRKKLSGTRPKLEQHKLVISVTRLGQNETRFSDLAGRFQKKAVDPDQLVNDVVEVLLRSGAELERSQLIVSFKGYRERDQSCCTLGFWLPWLKDHITGYDSALIREQQHTKSMQVEISIIALKGFVAAMEFVYLVRCIVMVYDFYTCNQSRMIVYQWMTNTLSCVMVSLNGQFLAGEESSNFSAVFIWDCSTELVNIFQFTDKIDTIKWTGCLCQMQQKRVLTLWRSQFVLLADDVAGILKKLLDDSNCIQWGWIRSQSSQESVLLCFVSGCTSDDMLQNFCTETWLIVTARWSCDQRLRAFYEAVQISWFPGKFWPSNGTDSFSVRHRWKYKRAIALREEQQVDKLKPLKGYLPSDFISSTGRSVFADNIKTSFIEIYSRICPTGTELAETELKEVGSCDDVLAQCLSFLKSNTEKRGREVILLRHNFSEMRRSLQKRHKRLLSAQASMNQREDHCFGSSHEFDALEKGVQSIMNTCEMKLSLFSDMKDVQEMEDGNDLPSNFSEFLLNLVVKVFKGREICYRETRGWMGLKVIRTRGSRSAGVC